MKVKKEEQETIYRRYWHPIQNSVGYNNLTSFFRHYLMMSGSHVNQKEVYSAFLKRPIDASNVINYLVEFRKFAAIYAKLLEPEQNEKNSEVRERLERLNRIKATTTYPFLLNIYNDYQKVKLDSRQIVTILSMVENFLIRRFICHTPSAALNKIFLSLYNQTIKRRDTSHTNFVDALAQTLAIKG
jgi:hypothetical protein